MVIILMTDGDWDKTIERMMLNFAASGHTISFHQHLGMKHTKRVQAGYSPHILKLLN